MCEFHCRVHVSVCYILHVEDASGLNSSSHPSPHRTISSPLSSCWEQLPALSCCARCSCSCQQHHWSNLGYPSVKTRRLSWLAEAPLVIIKCVSEAYRQPCVGKWLVSETRCQTERDPSSSASWGHCHPGAHNHQWLLTRHSCEGFRSRDQTWHNVGVKERPAACVCVESRLPRHHGNEDASFFLWSAFTSFTSNAGALFSSCNILLVLGEGRTSPYL